VVNAGPAEIALAPSISVALSAVAEALDYTRRPRVVVTSLDFPTVAYQWLAKRSRGVELVVVESPDRISVPVEAIERAVDDPAAGPPDRRVVRSQEPVRVRPARTGVARRRAPLRARHAVAGGGVRPARWSRLHRGDRGPGHPGGDRRAHRRPDRAGTRARPPAQGRAARRTALGDRHAAGSRSGGGRPTPRRRRHRRRRAPGARAPLPFLL